jgi:hypothetical protein
MNTVKKPYELLVRWGPDGKLRGAHVQWTMLVTDDIGAVIGCYPGNVEPLALTQGQAGFPLADILSQTQADALAALTAEQEKSAALATQLSEANAQIVAEQQKIEAAQRIVEVV